MPGWLCCLMFMSIGTPSGQRDVSVCIESAAPAPNSLPAPPRHRGQEHLFLSFRCAALFLIAGLPGLALHLSLHLGGAGSNLTEPMTTGIPPHPY
ncbi:hypothetical protein RB213_004392 [Colletotrichum asianum]